MLLKTLLPKMWKKILQENNINYSNCHLSYFKILKHAYEEDSLYYKKYKNKLIVLAYYGNAVLYRLKTMQTLNYQTQEYYILKYGQTEGLIKFSEYISYKSKLNTKESFLERFGVEIGTEKWNLKRENMLGEKNPAYNHGGKLSPWSNNFIYKESFDIETCKNKAKDSNNKKGRYRTKEYYTKRFLMSEEEAKIKVSEIQRTFTLEKCIEKYGYDEGVFVWQKRQEKWQHTRTNKDDEELKRLYKKQDSGSLDYFIKKYGDTEQARIIYEQNCKNQDTGSLDYFIKKYGDTEQARIIYEDRCNRTGYCMKPPLNEDIPGKLYYIRFWNNEIEFWKIGVTKNSIEERFGTQKIVKLNHNLNYEIIFVKEGGLYYDCYLEEQRLLKENRANRIHIDYNGFKTSEAFKKDILCQN